MFFIKNLKFICEKKKISQNRLAKETNIPTSTIKNLFQDNVKNTNLEYAYKISKYLEINLIDMIEKDLEKEVE